MTLHLPEKTKLTHLLSQIGPVIITVGTVTIRIETTP